MPNEIEIANNDNCNPLERLLRSKMPNGSEVYIAPLCKMCNSAFRIPAEKLFEDGKPLIEIKAFMDQKGEPIVISNIARHMNEHFRKAEWLAKYAEYVQNIRAIQERRNSRKEQIMTTADVSWYELSNVLTIDTGSSLEKAKDKAEILTKHFANIRHAFELLENMENSGDQVRAIQEKFVQAWKIKIEGAKDEAEKQLYIGALTEFKQLLQSSEEPKKP